MEYLASFDKNSRTAPALCRAFLCLLCITLDI
nr:MAG TPA: hypothetical protein [Caudoviricetes sp.]